jgi:membrane protein required for colicin V production
LEFNLFDAIVIIISIVLGVKGFFRGIIKELAGLVGIIGGIFFAREYYIEAGKYINENLLSIPNQSAIDLVGFVSVFIAIWLLVWLIGEILSKMFEVAKLGIIDKLIGAVFSAGKFFLLIAIILSLLTHVEFLKEKLAKYQEDSITYPIMLKVGKYVLDLKPEDVQKHIDDVKKNINENIGNNIKDNLEDLKQNLSDNISDEINKEVNNSLEK